MARRTGRAEERIQGPTKPLKRVEDKNRLYEEEDDEEKPTVDVEIDDDEGLDMKMASKQTAVKSTTKRMPRKSTRNPIRNNNSDEYDNEQNEN